MWTYFQVCLLNLYACLHNDLSLSCDSAQVFSTVYCITAYCIIFIQNLKSYTLESKMSNKIILRGWFDWLEASSFPTQLHTRPTTHNYCVSFVLSTTDLDVISWNKASTSLFIHLIVFFSFSFFQQHSCCLSCSKFWNITHRKCWGAVAYHTLPLLPVSPSLPYTYSASHSVIKFITQKAQTKSVLDNCSTTPNDSFETDLFFENIAREAAF